MDQNQQEPKVEEEDNHSNCLSECPICSNGNIDLAKLKLEMIALKANNKILEGKLEKLEVKAQIQAMTEEANLNKLKEENKAIRARMEAAEEKAQMAKNELESTIKEIQQKMDEFAKQMAIQNMEHQKKMQDFEEKNALFEKMLEDMERKRKIEKNELMTSMEEKKGEEAIKLDMDKFDTLIQQAVQQKMEEFAKEMAILKEQLEKKVKMDGDQMKQNIVWSHLIKKFGNSKGNFWNKSTTMAIISANGLMANRNGKEYEISPSGEAHNRNDGNWLNVVAEQGFPISVGHCRKDNFAGPILYYYEVTHTSSVSRWRYDVGLSAGSLTDGPYPRVDSHHFYVLRGEHYCSLSGNHTTFKLPIGATKKPEWNGVGDVVGCGILLSPENKLSIFFTLDGQLMGQQIPISPSGDCLYPTVNIWSASLEANFGHDPAKPFKYEINKCPGLVFD